MHSQGGTPQTPHGTRDMLRGWAEIRDGGKTRRKGKVEEKKRDTREDGKELQRKRFLLASRYVEAQGVCVIKCFLLLFSFSFLIY
jgi:hypothetical protein